MKLTKIEWTDCTWNFITGCTQVSPACDNCYAKAMTKRLQGMALKNIKGSEKYILGWDKVRFHQDALKEILDKKKYPSGSKVFVNSMSDTFHENIEYNDLEISFTYTRKRRDLIFQFLTKRPKEMIARFKEIINILDMFGSRKAREYFSNEIFKHCWFGVTAENQKMADDRIPELLNLREFLGKDVILFVSIEPMLEFMNIRKYLADFGLDWVIVGGENAPKSKVRNINPYWVHSILEQCKEFNKPLFFKQWGNFYNHKNELESIEKEIESYKQFPKIKY